jgi:hypothetical protein
MGSPRGAGTRPLHGKMMSEDLDQTAAAYALGIARGPVRAAIEARLSSDPALQAKIKLWQENFVAVDLAASPRDPRTEPYRSLPATFRSKRRFRRAGSGCPEVPFRRRRWRRVEKPAHFHAESHEECLVLEGDLIMGDMKLLPGDFHVAAKGSTHPAATTRSGCVLYQSIAF